MIATGLVLLVAFLHLYFMLLEVALWTKPLGLRTFRNTLEFARATRVLAANQGLYNGFLAAGLVWAAFDVRPEFGFQLRVFFLGCVIVAGVFGAATVSRRILFVQTGPALIALVASAI